MTTWDERMTRRPEREPRLELLETCWKLRTPKGRLLTCGIYRTDVPGLEVRAGFSDEDLIRSDRSAEICSAREIAAAWKQAVLAKGGFSEVPTVC
jgi:hypothetical protein